MDLLKNIFGGGIGDVTEGIGRMALDLRQAITGEATPEQRAKAQEKILRFEMELRRYQAEILREEARHKSIFVAGWRPFIGWVCGCGFAMNFIIIPIANWILFLVRPGTPPVPTLEAGKFMPVLLGMLGLGSLRTIEKTRKVNGRH